MPDRVDVAKSRREPTELASPMNSRYDYVGFWIVIRVG